MGASFLLSLIRFMSATFWKNMIHRNIFKDVKWGKV